MPLKIGGSFLGYIHREDEYTTMFFIVFTIYTMVTLQVVRPALHE